MIDVSMKDEPSMNSHHNSIKAWDNKHEGLDDKHMENIPWDMFRSWDGAD